MTYDFTILNSFLLPVILRAIKKETLDFCANCLMSYVITGKNFRGRKRVKFHIYSVVDIIVGVLTNDSTQSFYKSLRYYEQQEREHGNLRKYYFTPP